LLGWLDLLLMLGLWLFVWQTFGHRTAAMGLLLWAAPPLVFDYLAGSFLRWDWLFALGMAACFLQRQRPALAGAFLGYAVATKIFPLFFGVGLLLRELYVLARTRRPSPGSWRLLVGALASGAAWVAIAAAMFGPGAWVEYAQRIQVAQLEKFYSIQYSLKTVYLQVVAGNPTLWSQTLFPGQLRQAQPEVDIGQYAVGFLLARLAFTWLVAQLARRATEVEAFLLGPLLVFTWLTVNMYYWNMLGLLALGLFLRRERSPPALALLVGLQVILMFYYLYQHLNRGFTEGFAVATLLAAAIAATGLWEWRLARREEKVLVRPLAARA
jgi:xanthosine utilization system XapX-like protein